MRVLAGAIILYTLLFSGVSLWKYDDLRYNARDLAIYNQVEWQLSGSDSTLRQAQGDNTGATQTDKLTNRLTEKLYSSIQGHNYLGDHFEPILLLIAPLYALFPDPRTLLVLQTLALALTAFPLYLITKLIVETTPSPPYQGGDMRGGLLWLPTLVGMLWLLHPAVQNANLFEFHSLSFAPLFFFFLFYYWLKIKEPKTDKLKTDRLKNCTLFTLFLLLSLSVREDVALITGVFGLILLLKKARGWLHEKVSRKPRGHGCPDLSGQSAAESQAAASAQGKPTASFSADSPEWRLAWMGLITIVGSIVWLFLAQRIISHFSPSLGYQFRIYYEWIPQLGNSGAMLKGVIAHILTLPNLEMLIGLFLPLLCLPILKPKWLMLSAPPLVAIMLSAAGGGALIWQTHYGLLMLPGIFLALISALTTYTPHPQQFEKKHSFVYSTIVVYANEFLKDKNILFVCVITAAISSMLAFGPLIPALHAITADANVTPQKEILGLIPLNATVASTDRFLAPLSSRRDLALLPLTLLGVQQYGAAPYPHAAYPDYLLLDKMDMRADIVQAYSIAWTQPYAAQMKKTFRRLLEGGGYSIVWQQGTAALLTRTSYDKIKKIPPFSFEMEDFTNMRGGLTLDGLRSVQLVIDVDE